MKNTSLLFFALLMSSLLWQGMAQVSVGEGTNTERYPFGNYYGFESSSAIYTAEEIGFTGTITGMAWYADLGGKGSRPIKIYLKKFSNAVFPLPVGQWPLQIAGAVLVYQGNLTPIAGWNTITFDVPFVYDQDNLMVMVEANYGGNGNGGGTIGNAVRYSFAYLTHAYWGDNNAPSVKSGTPTSNRPNIRINFTPPIPSCNGIPNGGVATVTPTSGVDESEILMAATGYENGYGTTYKWQLRYNGGNWQQIGNTSSTYTDESTTVNGEPGDLLEVRLQVNCTISNETSYSTSAYFEIVPPTSYCIPTYTEIVEYLSLISSEGALTDIYYSTEEPPTDGNAMETSLPFVVYQGLSFNITTTYEVGPYAVKIWVDWNNDFFFGAAEGLAYEWSGDYEKTLPITIPIDAPPGDYRMRVRGVFSYTAGDPDPCDNYYLGSTVDFTLSIVPSRSCLFPEDLIATNIGVTSADISWTPKNGETMWNVIFGESGFDPLTEGSTISVSNIPALALTQLSANTIYDVYLRAICATNDESFLTFPMSFRTECGITTVPYSMDFETSISPNLPLCTSAENNGVGNDWKTRDSVAEFIGGMLYYSYHTTNGPANSWFFTQGIELQASKTYNISFIYANSSHDYTNSFKVAYGTSPTEASMATQITDIPTFIGRSPKDRLHTFSVAEDGVYYFGFNVYSRPNQGGLYIDDINIVEVPRSGYVYENNVWSPENPSGISSSLDNITVINGTAELSANTSFKNLTIKQGATLNINKVVRIYGDLIIYGDLVFVSNAIRNAELRSVSSTTNITGDITVESYMSSNRSYRMVSSAVTTATSIHDNWQEGASSNIDNPSPGFGTHITGTIVDQANGFDRTASGNPSMFTVNTAAQAFVAVTNTDINTLDAGTPYLLFVRGDRSTDLSNNASVGETVLRAKGRLHIGPDTQTFNTVGANHFVMFGNPYQSAVNINNVFTNSTNLKTGQYYVYDPNLGDHGSYVTVVLPAGSNTSGSDANLYLQAGQGAQVGVLTAGVVNVVFKEGDRTPGNHTTTSAMDNRLSSDNMLTVQLYTTDNYSNGGPTHDSFGIIFGDGLDNEITPTDAIKPMNFYENLGIDHNGTYLSIERREMPIPAETYPLYSSGYAHSNYTLKINIDGLEDTFLYLDDHFTGTTTLIEGGETVYAFSVSADDALSIATDRFSMRTEERLGVDNNSILAGVRLFPNPMKNDTFYIHAPKLNGEQISVSVSDLSGRQMFEKLLNCHSNMVTVSVNEDLSSGVYMVTLRHGGEESTYRLIKK